SRIRAARRRPASAARARGCGARRALLAGVTVAGVELEPHALAVAVDVDAPPPRQPFHEQQAASGHCLRSVVAHVWSRRTVIADANAHRLLIADDLDARRRTRMQHRVGDEL